MRPFVFAALAVLSLAVAAPAGAEKDKENGHGKDRGNQGREHGKKDKDNDRGGPVLLEGRGSGGPSSQFVIVDRDRSTVSAWYRDEFARGNCPPGLAKKDNGCLPPGQAKRLWALGQPLPPTVHYYPLPQPLYSRLTPPPYGHEYVRVDDDVLLMQSANRSIVNIIVNLR